MHIQHVYKPLNAQGGILYAWFSSMHTRVDVILYRKSEEGLLSVVHRIEEELQRLEKVGNFYDPDSELYLVNQLAANDPVHISKELYAMIDMCMEYHPRTLGCFDITIQSEGYQQNLLRYVILSPENQTVFFQKPGIRIDLSGFLKGYALEKVRDILRDHGIEDALMNIGNSSVLALGNHPHGEGWKINFAPDSSLSLEGINHKGDVILRNQCLTTSGNESDERQHILCPQTGKHIEGAGRLTVVTENGAEGEIFSTALFAATAWRRQVIIEENHLNVL